MNEIIKNLTKVQLNKIVYQHNKKHILKYRNENKEKLKLKRTLETVFCNACNKDLKKDYYKRHLDSKRHLKLQKTYDENH